MMSFLHDDDLLTGQLLAPDSIVLTSEQVDWAIDLSHRAASEAEQWQTYLNGLALLGLQEWLQKRSPELVLVSDWLSSTSDQPSPIKQVQRPQLEPAAVSGDGSVAASVAASVCRAQVGNSQLYLLVNDGLGDAWVTVPQTLSESKQDETQNSEQTGFYVLMEVLEELSEVRVQGYLPQPRLQAELAETQQSAQPEGFTEEDAMEGLLPIQAFSLDPDALLLHLRAGFQLNSALAARPESIPESIPESGSATNPLVPALVNPPLVNVGLWLNNQLDALAEALAWVLLPPAEVDLSGALRGHDIRDLDLVVRNLKRERALVIPADARVAYRDITLEGLAARLYALVWVSGDHSTWSLLLILGAQPGFPPPRGLRLRVTAAEQLLSDKQLEQNPYLYVQVAGERDEQIQVTLIAPNGAILPVSDFFLDT